MRFIPFALLFGCASFNLQPRGMHQGLNAVTDIVDPAYSAAISACDSAERYVIAREDTDEQETHDIAAIRTECDRVFGSFEAVRLLQLAAREAVDAADHGGDIQAAVRALADLQNAITAIVAVVGSRWTPGGVQ